MKSILAKLVGSLTLVGFLMFTSPTYAQVELPFGGLASFSLPCTCSATLSVWFTPLYLGGPVAITGPMVYSPYSTIPYAYFMIGIPGIWHIGSYLPGVQACWMIVPVGCAPFPTIGLMTKVGTNRF